MTTIRAHPPVETPAGLVVALPPNPNCTCRGTFRYEWPVRSEPPSMRAEPCHYCIPPDVFALAVPCPTCEGHGYLVQPEDGSTHPCDDGCDDGWVHHGDYRVLEVLPIVAEFDRSLGSFVFVYTTGLGPACDLVLHGQIQNFASELPGAVPGGVALIVERVVSEYNQLGPMVITPERRTALDQLWVER